MIITRTPLRITLGGGGSDLHPGGRCVAAAIDKYVYIAVNDHYDDPPIFLKYSNIERVKDAAQIDHPLIRKAFQMTGTEGRVEVSSMADLPAGTGLGSSGAFTVGLLHALHAHNGDRFYPRDLAVEACQIDTGHQDQWIAAMGAARVLTFPESHAQGADTRDVPGAFFRNLDGSMLLYDTGIRHDTKTVLADANFDLEVLARQADETIRCARNYDFAGFAKNLTAQWRTKHELNPTPAHDQINDWIDEGLRQGAYGAKLIGAGDGGCILFMADGPLDLPLREIPFRFDYEGSKRIV